MKKIKIPVLCFLLAVVLRGAVNAADTSLTVQSFLVKEDEITVSVDLTGNTQTLNFYAVFYDENGKYLKSENKRQSVYSFTSSVSIPINNGIPDNADTVRLIVLDDDSRPVCPAVSRSISGQNPQIERAIIYEGHNVTITVTGMQKSGIDWDVSILIENNSELNLSFNAHAYAVNGIMTRNNIYDMRTDVMAGKKATAKLKLKASVLSALGVDEIRCIDCLFWAYDNDKHFKEFDTGQIEIRTSHYNSSHDSVDGRTIYDKNGIRIDYMRNRGNKYDFFIHNSTGAYFNLDFREITINAFTVTGTDYDLYNETVLNGCGGVFTITVAPEFMEDNNIRAVESIEWNMDIRPYGDYFSDGKSTIGPIVFVAD